MAMRQHTRTAACAVFLVFGSNASRGDGPLPGSVFYPPALVARAKENVRKYSWAAEAQKRIVEAAAPWMNRTDDELWGMMFGATITRSWMVWSNGYCPSCRRSVPMYNWRIDAMERPWKVQCPHCRELFPKNDFGTFYRSGLDEHGVFDPKRADRSLLFNVEHPGESDPLRRYGVDDGEGYVEGDKRWRFIGAYLIYGQWKQAVLGGIVNLAGAYVLTGDPAYAHKAAVLLDRVADVYPTFAFDKQGVVYEIPQGPGYVSIWHDAAVETRQLILAYDQIRAALAADRELVAFLGRKASAHRLENPKASAEDIRRNIEDRILRDCITSRRKIESNYPQTDVTIAMSRSVLGGPGSRDEVNKIIDGILTTSTAVDGMTGEKGLAGYAAYALRGVGDLLGRYSRSDPAFLPDILRRHPKLHDMYRFHIDTWCLQKYYPTCGDAGAFARQHADYAGASFSRSADLQPSMYTLVWELCRATGDKAFAQILYLSNDRSVEGLPHDLFAEDPAAIQREVKAVVEREGDVIAVPSVNKPQWCIAVLRAGRGDDARVMWLDYDSGGRHSHADGMNLGLYAKGLDLMPDFGYPPVQFGGWGSPRARWYTMSAAHNTVVVDGADTKPGQGATTLWADGRAFEAIRASAPGLIGGKQYERTAAMIDSGDGGFYVFDVFRVVGGADHRKFFRSHFGTITRRGIPDAAPAEDFAAGTPMRGFRGGPAEGGWTAEWTVEDVYKYLPAGRHVRVRYTDLTTGAEAYTGESWVTRGLYEEVADAWIPHVMVRRTAAAAPLASTFVAIVEPFEKSARVTSIRRLPIESPDGRACPDACVAVEAKLADGRRDILVAADVENPLGLEPSFAKDRAMIQKDNRLRTDAELCFVRFDAAGSPQRVALCKGSTLSVGGATLSLKGPCDFIEIEMADGKPVVVAGRSDDLRELSRPAP